MFAIPLLETNVFADLIGNLTGTSGTTFMLCSIELMLAGLCINIPMLRPFYLAWRRRYKESSMGNSASGPGTGREPGANQQRPGQYTQWMELVSLILETRKEIDMIYTKN